MRTAFSVIFIIAILAMGVCSIIAQRSRRSIGPAVAFLMASFTLPVLGNLLLILYSNELFAWIGYYIYFLGMDVMMFALIRFTFKYCNMTWPYKAVEILINSFFGLDLLQYILNPFLHFSFSIEPIIVDKTVYYRLVPYLGQTFHRFLDYGIFLAIIILFIVKAVRSPRIYRERYTIILIAIILGGISESFYIFSRTPMDISVVGFVVVGMFIFYFSIYYRPMRLLDRMLSDYVSGMGESLFFFDGNKKCVWANDPGRRLLEIEARNYEQVEGKMKAFFQGGEPQSETGEWKIERSVGEGADIRYYVIEKRILSDRKDQLEGYFLSFRDQTEEKKKYLVEKYNATHDHLTGIYTKDYLFERIREKIDAHPDEQYMICYFDVNDFKLVNDVFGNEFGDLVLCRIAKRIESESSEFTLYGRLIGDTFGICVPKSRFNPKHLEDLLSHFVVSEGNRETQITVHIGVYEVKDRNLEIAVMFDRARMALSTIKGDYQTHIAYYDDKMREDVLWAQRITNELPKALEEKQICPYLQPIVGPDGRILGAEALVRWIHPEFGYMPPAKFIPIFEKNGMIADVDKYMWRSACEILSGWKENQKDWFLSINISPKDFFFMDVAAEIKKIAEEYKINPGQLRVEITETVMMTEIEKRIQIINELRNAGFLVEMDDFGSGYSSLNMLKDMPVDIIKIDMAFLTKSTDDVKSKTILKNIVTLSENLGIESLTEGVETKNQYEMLRDMGCRMFQGYYFAKPLPLDEFENYSKAS